MTFTIILPVYGSSPWLEEALDSVEKQKCNNWNLLIADDGLDQKAMTMSLLPNAYYVWPQLRPFLRLYFRL